MRVGERLLAAHLGFLFNTWEESYPTWLFTDAGPSHPSQGPPPVQCRGRWLSSVARPWLPTAGVLLVLHAQAQQGCGRVGWTRALQARGGRAGRGAGRGAARQTAGQRVAGRGAAGARAPEQFRAEAGVAARVLGQVVAPGEALGAERAGKALLAGVRPVVAGQLVGARELLVAARPVAGKGAFAWAQGTEDRQTVSAGGHPQDPGHWSPHPPTWF